MLLKGNAIQVEGGELYLVLVGNVLELEVLLGLI
jgi:hypothetical protein